MNNWKKNLKEFQYEMIKKIAFNFEEKGTSWKQMYYIDLEVLLKKYLSREDFVSVANIAFMLFDNKKGEKK